MAYEGLATDQYLDAASVTQKLAGLIRGPVYGILPDALRTYEEELLKIIIEHCFRRKQDTYNRKGIDHENTDRYRWIDAIHVRTDKIRMRSIRKL